MRVITGTARGRKLVTVEGTEVVRPTTDGVKEAIFSAIQFEIEGRTVLDLRACSIFLRARGSSASRRSAAARRKRTLSTARRFPSRRFARI